MTETPEASDAPNEGPESPQDAPAEPEAPEASPESETPSSEAVETPTEPSESSQGSLTAQQKLWLFRLAAILIPLLLVEGASRLYWSVAIFEFSSEADIQTELFFKGKWDKKLPYVFTPNTDSKVAKTPTHINNIGYRGDEDVDLRTPYRGLRILCVGDSVTFGYCVSGNKAAYPAVLEKKLREGLPRTQVINGGMPRYRSDHMRFMFEQSLPLLKPQVLVILGGWNDLNDHVLRPKTTPSSSVTTLGKQLYLVKVVAEWKKRGWFSSERARARIRPRGYSEYREQLSALIKVAKAQGTKVYICTLPHFYGNTKSDEAKAKAALFSPWGTLAQIEMVVKVMNETIRDLAETQKLGLIDLAAIQDAQDFEDAIHPNDTGSAKIAEIIFQRLKKDLFKK